jgi:MerR family transcriptional regulator, thiopeptide resistance regulator
MLTVTKLAQSCGLSRSAVLYYESIGLLKPARRTQANYRAYSGKDAQRLAQICVYRNAGLTLDDIRAIFDQPASGASSILRRRLLALNAEVNKIRTHQQAIGRLLQKTSQMRRTEMMTKDKWVEIMRAAGFSDEDMRRWHAEFEKAAPAEHQEFLEFLHIPAEELKAIREWSRQAG